MGFHFLLKGIFLTRIEPESPALTGGFFTSAPAEKTTKHLGKNNFVSFSKSQIHSFGIQNILPFETTSGHLMYFIIFSFYPQLLKNKDTPILQRLIAFIKNKHVLVEQSFSPCAVGKQRP